MRSLVRQSFLPVLLALVCVIAGCSSNSGASKVSMTFPDWDELHATTLKQQGKVASLVSSTQAKIRLVSVNLTGADLPTQSIYRWEKSDATTAPTGIDVEVSKGSGRLVQVLAIYEGDSTQSYYYGDALADISGNTAVSVALQNIAATQNFMEGRITGRYLTSIDDGPTAKFQYRFDPDAMKGGKPAMIIDEGAMYSGWLNVYATSSKLIDYTWADGTPLFPVDTSISPLYSLAQPKASAKIMIPSGFFDKLKGSFDAYAVAQKPATFLTSGFFGPGAGLKSRRLCIQSANDIASSPTLSNLFSNGDPSNPYLAPSNPVKWIGKLEPNDTNSQAYVTDPDGSGPLQKGGDENSNCFQNSDLSPGIHGQDVLYISPSNFVDPTDALYFVGPFQSYGYASYTAETGSYLVSWNMLAGTLENTDGVSVFWRVLPANSVQMELLKNGDRFRCGDFTNPSKFAVPFKEIVVRDLTTPNYYFNMHAQLPQLLTGEEASRVQTIVCARESGTSYYREGFQVPPAYLPASAHPIKLVITSPESIPASACVPITFSIEQNSAPRTLGKTLGFYVNAQNSGFSQFGNISGSFYEDSACVTQNGSTTFPANTSSKTMYLKVSTGGVGEISGSINATGQSIDARKPIVVVGNTATNEVVLRAQTELSVGACYPLELSLLDSNGRLGNYSVFTQQLSASPTGAASFYTDQACTNSLPSNEVTFAISDARKIVYFQANNSTATQIISSGEGLTQVLPVQTGSNVLAGYRVRAIAQDFTNSSAEIVRNNYCMKMRVFAVNAVGSAIPFSNQQSRTVSVGADADLSLDSGCGVVTKSLNVPIAATGSEKGSRDFFLRSRTPNPVVYVFVNGTATQLTRLPDDIKPIFDFGSPFPGRCEPLSFVATDFDGTFTSSQTFKVLIWGSNSIFTDSSCSVIAKGEIEFAGSAVKTGYYMNASSVPYLQLISAHGSYYASPRNDASLLLRSEGSKTLNHGSCVDVSVNILPLTVSTSWNLSVENTAQLQDSSGNLFYSDSACTVSTGASNSVTVQVNANSPRSNAVYLKIAPTTSAGSFSLNATQIGSSPSWSAFGSASCAVAGCTTGL